MLDDFRALWITLWWCITAKPLAISEAIDILWDQFSLTKLLIPKFTPKENQGLDLSLKY